MTATFLKSAHLPQDFPPDLGREVAFAGRSNSGKSTAINAVVGTRKLARTSKTPGRTRLINFFSVGPSHRIVDLPGYGFARVPPQVQQHWQLLLEHYFSTRRSLAGVLITVDIRRGLTELDRTMIGWTASLSVPTVLLLTKADKLSRGAAMARRRDVGAGLGPQVGLILFSAQDSRGVDETRERLAAWLEITPLARTQA